MFWDRVSFYNPGWFLNSRIIYASLPSARVTGMSPAPPQELPCCSTGGQTWSFSQLATIPSQPPAIFKGQSYFSDGHHRAVYLFWSLGTDCSFMSDLLTLVVKQWQYSSFGSWPCLVRPLTPSYNLTSWITSASLNVIFSGAILSAPHTSFIPPFY